MKFSTPPDFTAEEQDVIQFVKPYTMTSVYKIKALMDAVNYICRNQIQGDFVECGVWKGGSVMTMINMLLKNNIANRKLWLFDTFEGMPEPTENDHSTDGIDAAEHFEKTALGENNSDWCRSTLDDVKSNISLLDYPSELTTFVKGDVCETLKDNVPDKIALLRLDTDWYSSTKAELEYLYPKLVSGGVLIIDDYGYWKGQKKAVDEYFEAQAESILLCRVDSSCRIAIKR